MSLYKFLMIPATLSLAFISVSCDNVDENNRYEGIEKPVLPPHSVPKTLLIQEFTGNMCTNCPQGAAQIHNIQEEYPGQVIAVGLHPAGGGPNTEPIGTQDFRCQEAQVLFEYFLPSGFPCAVFNGETKSTRFALWYGIAAEMLSQEANMTIDAVSKYDSSSRNVTVDYTVTPTADLSGDYSVMVWIMENDIVGFQLDGGTLLDNYVHNHVLRASLNGDWGVKLPANLYNGESIDGSASMIIDQNWVAENCQIIVYVFQTNNKYVEQSTLIDVIPQD